MRLSKTILTLLFIIGLKHSQAQDAEKPSHKEMALKNYIPADYETLDITKGNLNRDAYTDVIMILRRKDEKKNI